jgi:hypothetical protein
MIARPAAKKPRTKRTQQTESGAARDVVAAMNDRRLFEPWFRGPTWDGWRAVLKGAFALPMSDAELAFFRTVAERDPPKKRVRELWIVAGRRAGKDSIASLIAAHAAATFDRQDKLRPGERALVSCLAYDRDQSRIILDYTRGYFSESALLQQLVQEDERASDFQLANRVDVAILTNSFRAVRGRPILLAVLDELSVWRDETSQNPDEEVYRAILPGLASIDGMIVGISSPYKKSGLLWNKFRKHFGKPGDDVLVIRAPTTLLNPTIDPAVIDAALAEDPAAAKAEWLAEFRDDIGGWLLAETIEAAIDAGITVRPPNRMFTYFAFIDPSGGARDSYTCAIAHKDGERVMLDALVEIKPPFDPAAATAQIAAVLKEYRIGTCQGDRYAAQWVVGAFQTNGISYRHSERDRSEIYRDAMPLFTSGRACLLDNRKLVSQFCALERKTSSMGKDKIDHGPGGHDDLCNAAAGAMVLANVVKRPMTCVVPEIIHGGTGQYFRALDTTGARIPAGHYDLGGGPTMSPPSGWPIQKPGTR